MTCRLCYYIYVAYDGNELNTVCGSGGTADALASGASGGRPRGGSNPLYRTI